MLDSLRENAAIIVVIVVLLFGAFVAINATIRYEDNYKDNYDDKLWNGGYCNICGGSWKYEQAVGHRRSTSYIYVCDGCGRRIALYNVK